MTTRTFSPRPRQFKALPALLAPMALLLAAAGLAQAADPVTLTVRVDQPGAKIDPIFYGLMTEEINFSYEGGLYGELIRNRIFQDVPPAPRGNRRNTTAPTSGPATVPATAAGPATNPAAAKNPHLVNWTLFETPASTAQIDIDTNNPVNATALSNSLKLDIKEVQPNGRVGVSNAGYWGIPVRPDTEYTASFYARASQGFAGPIQVSIENEGFTNWTMNWGVSPVYAHAEVASLTTEWKKYTVKLKTGSIPTTSAARFVISATTPGTVWLSFVSLFPPTYKNRVNGNRPDIMELLAGMKPSFLRFPGGNYLEGNNFANRFDWKKTIGPLEERPGHMSPWNYRSSDGFGLLEFLGWCDDLNMEPILAVYAGMHLDGGRTTITGDALKPFVDEALEEIEYVTGDVNTKWGALRAKHGHPEPFKLRYVEVGNEDWLNNGKQNYAGRFAMFYDAIKAKYPNLQVTSSLRSADKYDHTRKPDVLDDHFYISIPVALDHAHYYDKMDRSGPKIFVGEWATNNPGSGNVGHMAFALGDAAFMTGMERNADIINMHCYAPLLVNVNPGGRQWQVNLIGYDALGSFGSPAYYAQKMFASNRGDTVLPATFEPLPKLSLEEVPKAPVGNLDMTRQPKGPFDAVYVSATSDSATGDVILKLVNVQAGPQTVNLDIQGVSTILPSATGEVLTGDLGAMNSVAEPTKVAPKALKIDNAGPKFAHELPGHSVTVLRLKTK